MSSCHLWQRLSDTACTIAASCNSLGAPLPLLPAMHLLSALPIWRCITRPTCHSHRQGRRCRPPIAHGSCPGCRPCASCYCPDHRPCGSWALRPPLRCAACGHGRSPRACHPPGRACAPALCCACCPPVVCSAKHLHLVEGSKARARKAHHQAFLRHISGMTAPLDSPRNTGPCSHAKMLLDTLLRHALPECTHQ